jgi:hypothetical protein
MDDGKKKKGLSSKAVRALRTSSWRVFSGMPGLITLEA